MLGREHGPPPKPVCRLTSSPRRRLVVAARARRPRVLGHCRSGRPRVDRTCAGHSIPASVLSDGRLFTPRNMDDLNLHDNHRGDRERCLAALSTTAPRRAGSGRRSSCRHHFEGRPARTRPILSCGRPFQAVLSVAMLALRRERRFRRGLIRMMGLELVTAGGRPASRLRVLARTAITWSPVLLVPFVMRFVERIPQSHWDTLVDAAE
mgnify:CR=1 FL=1